MNIGKEEEWTEKGQRCQRDWVKKLWHENPLTKFGSSLINTNIINITVIIIQTTCMNNSVWNLFKKYNKGIHDNISLERLRETKQKLKDAVSCLLH